MNEEHPYTFPWCFRKCKHFISRIKNVVIKQNKNISVKKKHQTRSHRKKKKKKEATEMLRLK